MQGPSAIEVLASLAQIVVKFLGRPAVQAQIVAAVIALALALYATRYVTRLFNRVYVHWLEKQRATMDTERLGQDPEVRRAVHFMRPVVRVVHRCITPLVCLLLIGIAIFVFNQLGWFSGLLSDISQLLWVFLAYRLIVALLYEFFPNQGVRKLHRRVLAPAFWVAILLIALQTLIDLNTLASARVLPLQQNPITVGGLFVATVGLYFWIVITGIVSDIFKWGISRASNTSPGSLEAGLTLARYGMYALGIFLTIQALGFDATTVAAITGGLSIGIGLALQDVLKNFLGGIIVLFEGSVRPGDVVEVGGKEGEIQKLSIRSTLVRTGDNVELIVPNQEWLNKTVTSYTHSARRMRCTVKFTLKSNVDVRQVLPILVATAKKHPLVLSDPAPSASLVDFTTGQTDFTLNVWVEDASQKGAVASQLRLQGWKALVEAGIVTPETVELPPADVSVAEPAGAPAPPPAVVNRTAIPKQTP